MTDLITEARELCEKATNGPWKWVCDDPEFLTLGKSGEEQEYHVLSAWKCHSCQQNGMNCLWPKHNDAEFISRSRTLMPELVNALEKANAEIEKADAEITQLQIENETLAIKNAFLSDIKTGAARWMPIEERLPEDDICVLVLRKNGLIDIARRKNVYGYTWFINCMPHDDITHWQPLPKSPLGE